jgi:hypothetical protein
MDPAEHATRYHTHHQFSEEAKRQRLSGIGFYINQREWIEQKSSAEQ